MKYSANVSINGSFEATTGPVVVIAAPVFYIVSKKTIDLSHDSIVGASQDFFGEDVGKPQSTNPIPKTPDGLPPGVLESYIP